MSVEKLGSGKYRVRYAVGGRGSPRRSATFDRKRDAELFEASTRRHKAFGDLALLDAGTQPVVDLAREWWQRYAVPNLAGHTLDAYARMLDAHVVPRLGSRRVRDVSPNVVRDFRAKLEASGVGRDSVRKSLVVLQAMFRYAEGSDEWGVRRNPVKGAEKPSAKRQRSVVCLAPSEVEAIRSALLGRGRQWAAALVSVIAYAGLRAPEEVLALEWRHVGRRTIVVEQRNDNGAIVSGQKVKSIGPRSVDLVGPLRRELDEWRMAAGRPPPRTLVFPRGDGEPWRRHDWNNWRRRMWHGAREEAGIESLPPYDLRHAFASLHIRAGTSLPELAEMLGHSPQMTLSTYTHVIRELKGEPVASVEDQILAARRPHVTHGPEERHGGGAAESADLQA